MLSLSLSLTLLLTLSLSHSLSHIPTHLQPVGSPGSPLLTPGSSEVCYFCGQRVYVLERVSTEGRFFHRGCFTCHQCGSTLRLGSYGFNQLTGEQRRPLVDASHVRPASLSPVRSATVPAGFCSFLSRRSQVRLRGKTFVDS